MRTTGTLLAAAALAALPAPPAAADPPLTERSDNVTVVSSTNFCDQEPFTNAGGDLAFWGDHAVVLCGNDDQTSTNDGFVLVDVSDPAQPRRLSQFACAASSSDLAIWEDLVFLAVDRNTQEMGGSGPLGEDCAAPSASYLTHDAQIFRGVRIVSIADPASPQLVASIPLEHVVGTERRNFRGAHTVNVLPQRAPDGTASSVYVYVGSPLDKDMAVLDVPVTVSGPADVSVSWIDTTDKILGCHDVSSFTPLGIAACTSVDRGTVLWDVRDDEGTADDGASPTNPKLLVHIPVSDPGTRHHSAGFSWDGQTLVLSNENNMAAAAVPTCLQDETGSGGGLLFYDISALFGDIEAERAVLRGYQPGHPGVTATWCTSVNFSVVPRADGRDVLIAGWYSGGTTVVDFTDDDPGPGYSAPRQVAHFRASPLDPERGSLSRGSYWYRGHGWVGNAHGCTVSPVCFGPRDRGLDVLAIGGVGATEVPVPYVQFGLQECLPAPFGAAHGTQLSCPAAVPTSLGLELVGEPSQPVLVATLVERDSQQPVAGQTIRFLADGEEIGSATTSADGRAEFAVDGSARRAHTVYAAVFDGTEQHLAAQA